MSLPGLPEYDSTAVPEVGRRAIVVGAGMGGLLAARILADGFEEVTVIERDPIPDSPETRDGVPQSRHTHGIKDVGRHVFEELFPGYTEEVVAEGGVLAEYTTDVKFYIQGDFLASGPDFPELISASRPLFEHVLRRRVSSLDPVHVRSGWQVRTYLTDETGTAVEGVEIQNGAAESEEVAADLVVDATGRASRTPTWLEQHGYSAPPVEEVPIDLAYSSMLIERPPDDNRSFLIHTKPPRTRHCHIAAIENERWLVSLIGFGGDYPPTDVEGFREFASSLPTSVVADLLAEHPIVTEEIHQYPFPSNRWYHYEDLDRFPSGLIVFGDAICSTNPTWGLGMSSAAFQALSLHPVLARGDLSGIEHRFFDAVSKAIGYIWGSAVDADQQYPHIEDDESYREKFLHWYFNRLEHRAQIDSKLSELYCETLSLNPVNIFHPRVMWRVFRPTLPG